MIMSEAIAGDMRTLTCKACKNKAHTQDTIYGKGKRAFIYSAKAFARHGGWKCTVCGGEQE